MSWYTVAWLIWAGVFALVEGKALASKRPGDTLSEHIWAVFHVKDPRPTGLVWALRGVLLIALAWLFFHLGFGWLSF